MISCESALQLMPMERRCSSSGQLAVQTPSFLLLGARANIEHHATVHHDAALVI